MVSDNSSGESASDVGAQQNMQDFDQAVAAAAAAAAAFGKKQQQNPNAVQSDINANMPVLSQPAVELPKMTPPEDGVHNSAGAGATDPKPSSNGGTHVSPTASPQQAGVPTYMPMQGSNVSVNPTAPWVPTTTMQPMAGQSNTNEQQPQLQQQGQFVPQGQTPMVHGQPQVFQSTPYQQQRPQQQPVHQPQAGQPFVQNYQGQTPQYQAPVAQPVQSAQAQFAQAQSASAQSVPAQSASAQSVPAQSAPVQSAQAQSAPVQSAQAQSVPAQSAPVQSAQAQSVPAQSAPVQSAQAQSVPAQSAPVQSAPGQQSGNYQAPVNPAAAHAPVQMPTAAPVQVTTPQTSVAQTQMPMSAGKNESKLQGEQAPVASKTAETAPEFNLPKTKKRGNARVTRARHTLVWSKKNPNDINALRARERRLGILWWFLAALAIFFAWASFGLMMRIGFLPTFDLGYSWFDSHITFFFGINAVS